MINQILGKDKILEIGIIKISRNLALISFIIGTLILILFYFTENLIIALIGFFYLLLAFVINATFLFGLIVKLFSKKSNKKQVLISIGIMLTNIPVAIFYYNITTSIVGTIID